MLPLSEKELDELVAQERERGSPPLTSWDSIAAQLRAEGLIKEQRWSALSLNRSTAQPLSRVLMQAAAALLLVAGGAAIGRYTASDRAANTIQSAAIPNAPDQPGVAQNVSATNPVPTAAEFKSADEAWATLNRAGEEYQAASAYLSASNTDVPMPTNPDTYRTRLAALDNVMTEMRAALHEAPHDPVINQYYMATVGAREATLRQLGTTLPAGARLNRF
jgi:hypothetical protein